MVGHIPPIIGRLRLALASGRGLQANAEEVAQLACACGLHTANERRRTATMEAAVAKLPCPDHLRAIARNPGTVGTEQDIAAMAALALAVLGEP